MSLTNKEYFHIHGFVKPELLSDMVDDQEDLLRIKSKVPDLLDRIEAGLLEGELIDSIIDEIRSELK